MALRILENPNLLEHEKFTDTLWAVLPLAEELTCRKGLRTLPPTDYAHLAGDLGRAYKSLISEWLNYMIHLKTHYPYYSPWPSASTPSIPRRHPKWRNKMPA